MSAMFIKNSQVINSQQAGFLLPAAIFLLVILAGLGAFAVNINAVQQNAGTQDIQGTRAYHAARGGIEWAAYQIMQLPAPNSRASCPATTTLSLGSFTVTVTCTANAYTENGGDHKVDIYEISSTASFGTVHSQGYIERKVDVTLSKCIADTVTPAQVCE